MESKTIIKDQGFLPDFCEATTVFMLALLTELFALILTLVATNGSGFWENLALISLFTQWVALLSAAILCLFRKWLNSREVAVNAAISFGILMGLLLLISLLIVFFGDYVGLFDRGGRAQIQYFLVRNIAIGSLVFAVVLRYFYIQHQWRLNIQAQGHAQIQALKARIRPHFLFNSMNTIASLIHIDSAKAEKAVEDLSDLFRVSLREQTQHTLADEIALTHSYIDIEQLRLGERLQAEWLIGEIPEEMEIPALCLQPLVENAIYHGIEPIPQGGIIKIQAQIENNRLCLSVSNPISTHSQMKNHNSNHMAQENIRTRLALTYGDAAVFEIEAEQELYRVSLRIPIERPEI
ncbi:MAG: histidine kinase [Gammaproteobacteria bacterium]|nr:histidine kinase [Gammaproteobacteria bacterium]